MLLLPSLKPTLHAERDPRGDTLLSPQLHLLLLTVCGLPPFKWQDLGVSLPIGRSFFSSFHSPLNSPASNPGTEIPIGAEEQFTIYQDLGQKVASCPLQVLQCS